MNKKIEIIEISSEEDEEEVERLKKLERESPFYCDRIARCWTEDEINEIYEMNKSYENKSINDMLKDIENTKKKNILDDIEKIKKEYNKEDLLLLEEETKENINEKIKYQYLWKWLKDNFGYKD